MYVLTICAFFLLIICVSGTGLKELFSWTRITYEWPGTTGTGSRTKRYAQSVVIEDPSLINSEERLFGNRGDYVIDASSSAPDGIEYNYGIYL